MQYHKGVGKGSLKESVYGPELLQQPDETLWKKRCCKSGRGEPEARHWDCGEDESRLQETWSAGASAGVKVTKSALKYGKLCSDPLAHGAADPEKGAWVSLAEQI